MSALAHLRQLYRRSRLHRWTSLVAGSSGPDDVDSEQFHDLRQVAQYLLVRKLAPERVIETGVLHGRSSLAILRGLHENNSGRLISIDVPRLGVGQFNDDGRWDDAHVERVEDTGREVPAYLRSRWTLSVARGPTEAMAQIRGAVGAGVDLFIHDSDHTYAWMLGEYGVAWGGLPPGGILYSDDIDWNDAFRDFAASWRAPRHEFSVGDGRIGAMVRGE